MKKRGSQNDHNKRLPLYQIYYFLVSRQLLTQLSILGDVWISYFKYEKCDNDVIAGCWHAEASGVRVDVPLKGCLCAQCYGIDNNIGRVRVVLTS